MILAGRIAPLSQWDTTLIDDLIDGTLYPHGLDIKRVEGYPHTDGCILVVPGRYWADRIDAINEAATRYQWLLLIRTSDEEDLFDIHKINHPNAKIWVQTPRTDRNYGDARLFGVGYPPHFRDLPTKPPDKTIDVYLAGQNTHPRRKAAFGAIGDIPNTISIPTSGFTQGAEPQTYRDSMLATKIAPCPAGPASPDTFRLWEALEAHCVPIADDITPGYDSAGYWRMLLPDAPFPILTDYNNLRGWITDQLRAWPANANRITAYWMRYKRQMSRWLVDDLKALGAI